MRLPRDLTGADLVSLLSRIGYQIVRQRGSHIRLRAVLDGVEHSVTIKLGTLNGILSDVAGHGKMNRDELLKKLFG